MMSPYRYMLTLAFALALLALGCASSSTKLYAPGGELIKEIKGDAAALTAKEQVPPSAPGALDQVPLAPVDETASQQTPAASVSTLTPLAPESPAVVEAVVLTPEQVAAQGGEVPPSPEPESTTTGAPEGYVPLKVSDLAAQTLDVFANFKIGPGDMLNFRSLDDETLASEVQVRYDGCVSLPWIPDVKVAGLNRDEALAKLREAYTTSYDDPQLSLTITQVQSRQFTVMGEVNAPRQYPYIRPVSLLDAIMTAGGMRVNQRSGDTYIGGQGQLIKALIVRYVDGKREVMEFDLRGIQKAGVHASDTLILPDDIIYVPESVNLVYLVGEVRSPGVFAITENMNMLNLVSLAGGVVEGSARKRQVVLIRPAEDGSTKVMVTDLGKQMKTGQSIPLQPGDIIYVPRKPLITIQEFLGRLNGTVTSATSLYQNAYDTYYTKERFDRLFSDTNTQGATGALATLQTLRDFGSLMGGLVPTPTTGTK